mgnify:CR=1 FL=1
MIRRCTISPAMSMDFQNRAESDFLRMIADGTIIAQKITIKIAGRLMLVKGIFPRKKKKNSWSITKGASSIAPMIIIK